MAGKVKSYSRRENKKQGGIKIGAKMRSWNIDSLVAEEGTRDGEQNNEMKS